MTREEIATRLENATVAVDASCLPAVNAAAAELRKTCATCQHDWHTGPEYEPYHECKRTGDETPADGSGFCHRWEPQPTGKAQD